MKIKSAKGMRDIPTIQGLSSRSVPDTKPQAATELARLEHEKARLERELNIWIANQKKTEDRLRQVEERLALVRQVLDPTAAGGSTKRAKVRRSPAGKTDSGEEEAQGWREIPLEY
jgi:septal ring factor EnvC (AmiA/AmiB activator)